MFLLWSRLLQHQETARRRERPGTPKMKTFLPHAATVVSPVASAIFLGAAGAIEF